MALKDWKKASKSIKTEYEQEGDTVYNIWNKNGNILFIIKSPNGYILGSKMLSQMDSPKIIKSFKTKAQALNFAKAYMRSH